MFLEKGIIAAALHWWRWWLLQLQTEAHTIRSKSLVSPNIYTVLQQFSVFHFTLT